MVVGDVPQVRGDPGRHLRQRAVAQALQRRPERYHRPLELQQLALELVDPAGVVGALGGEHRGLQLLHVPLEGVGHLQVLVDHGVGHGVQDRAGPSASNSGAASRSRRTPVSDRALPCRTTIAKPGPANTMISPVSTISLVAVTLSWST